MGRNLKIAVAAILALAIAGCSSQEVQQPSNPTPANTPAATKKAATQPFNNPVVPAKKAQLVASTSSLIQPTNATERVGVVLKGRIDPFGQIVEQYPVGVPNPTGVPNNTVVPKPVPVLPRLPILTPPGKHPIPNVVISTTSRINKPLMPVASRINKPPMPVASRINKPPMRVTSRINKPPMPVANRPKNVYASSGGIQKKANPTPKLTPVLPKVLPQVIPNQSLVSVLPPPPQPELAKAVLVSGVVLVGKEPQAIIKVPNEPASRYVQAGQQLASGLLIKRIEMNEGSDPTVILEQYGIEVAKMVGEAPVNAKPSSTASAGNPVSVTSPPQNPVSTGAM